MARIPQNIAGRSLDVGNVIQYPTNDPVGAAVARGGAQIADVAEHQRDRLERLERFKGLQEFDAFDTETRGALRDKVSQMPVGGIGFSETFMTEDYEKRKADFLAKQPPSLRQEMEARFTAHRAKILDLAATAEVAEGNRFQMSGIKDRIELAKKGVLQDGPAAIEAWKKDLDEKIVSGTLAPSIKEEAQKLARSEIAKAGFQGLLDRDPTAAQKIAADWFGNGVGSVVNKIIGAESGGDPNAKNPNSSATGSGQFIKSTWLSMVEKYRPELAQGRDEAAILALRNDPVLSREMTSRYTEENAKYLGAREIAPTPANLYLAHFLGPAGATKILSVTGDTSISSLLSPKEIGANASVLEGKKVSDVVAWAERKMGSGATTPISDQRFKDMSFDDMLTLTKNAEQKRALNIERGQTMLEADRAAKADTLLKQAADLNDKGLLTPDFAEQVRPYVTATQYSNLLKSMRADAEDDPKAIEHLIRNIDSMTPDQFQKEASVLLDGKKLKTGTYISLSEKNRNANKDDAPASAYRAGRDVVKTTLDPGQLLSGPASAIGRANMAQGLIEFDNWVAANPRADRATAIATGQEIIKRYQVVPYDQMKLAVGTSQYFGPKSRNDIVVDDVKNAELKLFDEIKSGKLSKEQGEFEVRLLNNWREILAKEQATKDAAKAGSNAKR